MDESRFQEDVEKQKRALAVARETLGVSADAGSPEIKRAYRQLAKAYHPDGRATSKARDRQFRRVTRAYQLLASEEYSPALAATVLDDADGKNDGKKTGNPWRFFLWWREQFFDLF